MKVESTLKTMPPSVKEAIVRCSDKNLRSLQHAIAQDIEVIQALCQSQVNVLDSLIQTEEHITEALFSRSKPVDNVFPFPTNDKGNGDE